MTRSWSEGRLADLCTRVTVGHVGSMRNEYVDHGIPFLRSQNVQPFRIDERGIKFVSEEFHHRLKKSALAPNDVVVVRTGYPGTAARIPELLPAANCADLVVITPGPELDSRYLVAVFNSAWGKSAVSGRLVGVAQQHFNVTVAKELRIPTPPLVVQQKIAAILAAYDELIENNLRRIEILEEMAQAVYREWFLNFRHPGQERVPLVDSPLGPIPEGWKVRGLFDLAEVAFGFSFKSSRFSEDGVGEKVIRIRDIPKRTTKTYTDEVADERYRVSDGDILIGMDGDFHMCVWPDGPAMLNQRVTRIRPIDSLPVLFLFHSLSEPIRHFNSTITGTTVAHLGKRHLETIKLVVPSEHMLKEAERVLDPILRLDRNLRRQNTNLRAVRNLLLPKLVSGKIDVSDLDIDTEWLAS